VAVSRPVPVVPEQRWPLARDGLAVIAVGFGLFMLVLLILPAEGRLAALTRDLLVRLFGSSAFVSPVALVLGGAVALARSLAPQATLPYTRLAGLGCLALATLPTQHLIVSESGGLIGSAIGNLLVDLVGGPATVFVLVLTLVIGALLTFDVRRWGGRVTS
jgi:hypothetical protein